MTSQAKRKVWSSTCYWHNSAAKRKGSAFRASRMSSSRCLWNG